jgi:hypothetical protein
MMMTMMDVKHFAAYGICFFFLGGSFNLHASHRPQKRKTGRADETKLPPSTETWSGSIPLVVVSCGKPPNAATREKALA